MDNTEEMLTDAEFCELLRINVVTLRRHLRKNGSKQRVGRSHLRDVRQVWVGGRRRWPKSAVMAFINGGK